MLKKHYNIFLLTVLSSFCQFAGYSEGTKQIMPVNTGIEKILAGSPTTQLIGFAYYSCPVDNRLNIQIKNPGEIIYFGFKKNDILVHQFRIKDPAGNIVVAATPIPTTGTGYIATWDNAYAGPNQIVGTGGYDAYSYTPVTTGDFYIEFSNSTTLLYFDITVATSGNAAINGRVWSKAWQFDTGTNPGTSEGTFYIYTSDSLVTSMNLNGLQGISYTVACNQMGCPAPSPATGYTRNSVDGMHVLPQYKIFLNDPDIVVYPTGTQGTMSGVLVTWNCDGTADITFTVTKAGTTDVLLDINPLPGQQAEDVLISQAVTFGPNLIHWNGLNGLSVAVPNGTIFNITVTYIMGLTNFPVYDVEQNSNGLIINLIRPTGTAPLVYWDDTQLTRYIDNSGNGGCTAVQFPPATTANTTGCPANTGCHTWLSMGCGDTPCQCSYGNRNTVNTYWYAVFYQAPPVQFEVHRYADVTAIPSGPATPCAGSSGNSYTIPPASSASTYQWTYTGTGATINPPANGTTVVIDFAPNATSGELRVSGVNLNCGVNSVYSFLALTVTPVPDVVASPLSPLTVCNNTPAVINFVSTVPGTINNTIFNWSALAMNPLNVSPPNPSGSTPNQISQAFSNLVNTPEGILIGITPVSSGCTGPQATYTLTVNPTPNVIFVNPATPLDICSGATSSPISLSSNVLSAGIGYNWTVTCNPLNISNCPPGGSALLIPEIPAVNPINLTDQAQDIVFTVTAEMAASLNQVCYGQPSDFTIHVNPKPGLGNTIFEQYTCSGDPSDPVTFIPIPALPANVSFNWTATPGPSIPPLTGYTPSGSNTLGIPAETINNPAFSLQYVDYTITPILGGGSLCQGDVSNYRIYVYPIPNVIFTPPSLSICSGAQADITFSTVLASAATYQWNAVLPLPANVTMTSTSGPGDFHEVITNTGSLPAVVQISVMPTSADGCSPSAPYLCSITVNPLPSPSITAVPATPASPCGFSTVTYTVGAAQANHAYTWAVTGGSPATGSGSSISVTWGNINPVSISMMESVTYGSVVCSVPASKFVTLNLVPDPAGVISGPASSCQSPTQVFTYTVPPIDNADSYTWWYTPPTGVTIINNGTSAGITFDFSSFSGNLYVRGNKTGCASGTQSPAFPVFISTPPTVAFAACFDPVTSISAKPFYLKGGTPLGVGGKYYVDGTLVPGNLLNPASLSVGSHVITFTYTDVNTCEASDSKNLVVLGASAPCGTTMTDFRDNPPTVYKTSFLGGRCWMTENLHYGTKVVMPSQTQPQPQTDNCISEKYCLSTDNTNCTVYGGLYQWDEITQYGQTLVPYQGLCPPAWHVPTSAEWQNLIDATQGNGVAGGLFQNGTFNALTMGIYYINNLWAFTNQDNLNATMYWTSTLSGNKPVARGINIINPSVSMYESSKANAFPVRCVRD